MVPTADSLRTGGHATRVPRRAGQTSIHQNRLAGPRRHRHDTGQRAAQSGRIGRHDVGEGGQVGYPEKAGHVLRTGGFGSELVLEDPVDVGGAQPGIDQRILGGGQGQASRIGLTRAAQLGVADADGGDIAGQGAHDAFPESRNCGRVTAPRSSNITSTGMPQFSFAPSGMSTRLVIIRRPGWSSNSTRATT